MFEQMKVIYKGGQGEIVEKKSRFIATVQPVETEEVAIQIIDQMKKKNWNATHNCFAYVIGQNYEIQRCSDDGEPSGTAGKPILDVLLGEELHNVIVIVTRYFGGTLLGTGGLVRAYQKSTQEGLRNSVIVNKCLGYKLEIITDYNGIGKIQYIIGQMNVTTMSSEYTDVVTIVVILSQDDMDGFKKKVIEATSAKVRMKLLEQVYYTKDLDEILIFE